MKRRILKLLLIISIILIVYSCNYDNFAKKIKNENIQLDTITSCYIKTINLKCNDIPDSVFLMKHLKILSITGEDCDILITDSIGNEIDECCRLKNLSNRIGQLQDLEILDLEINGLENLPKEIQKCQNLKRVYLTDNYISNIDYLVPLRNLEILSISMCRLKKLPINIGEMKKLKFLYLSFNKLEKGEIERVKQELPNCEIIN